MSENRLSEREMIRWIDAQLRQSRIGDDCAILPGGRLVTADTLVEGTHFLRGLTNLADLGWKAMAVNLSDIAAMGGRPRQAVVNLTLPEDCTFAQFRTLYTSMIECANQFRTDIVGGDLTGGRLLTISITVLGDQHESGYLPRHGAQVGDCVIVSGDFGASAGGLFVLKKALPGFERLKQAHLRPQPRLQASWQLIELVGGRGALMDASDGLADALMQISQASQVGMEINMSCIPLHPETKAAADISGYDPLTWALYGGEDYELVGTISPAAWRIMDGRPDNPFTRIGEVVMGADVRLEGWIEHRIDPMRTFQHW